MPELKTVQVINGLMDMEQAASYLGIKKDTLYSMVMRRQIPVVKIGRLNKFKFEDLEIFVNQNRMEAI